MLNSQLLYVKFFLRTTKKNPELGMLYLRISYNTKRIDFSFNYRVNVNAWDSSNEVVKTSDKDYLRVNQAIASARSKILNIFDKLRYEERMITPLILKNHYQGNIEEGKTLLHLIQYHNESQVNILSYGTLKNYFTTQKYIKKFLKEKKKVDDIYLSQLNYQFITGFESYLRNHTPTDHQRPLSNNGVMKHLERLRKMTTMAVKLEWVEKDPFSKYKLSFKKSERTFLSEKEVEILVNRNFSNERMDFTKDLFVFACYTGLAYVDVKQLKLENINIGIDGEYWISTKRQKTDVSVNIPLLPIPLEIID
ncbi:site-specific integrase [Saccharicrinis sp. 156]|uniref:site-specific integrase n=1 Tax=Saccharicrinis sp. 156 TaxID=3417574 RepID=UPI003D349F94